MILSKVIAATDDNDNDNNNDNDNGNNSKQRDTVVKTVFSPLGGLKT